MTATSELMLMLLADARLPTGAHTQSAGLEPAMKAGLSVGEVPAYLRARLGTVTTVEAGAAVVARHAALHSTAGIAAALTTVDLAWQARTMSAAVREASILAARGYLRLAASLWSDHSAVRALRSVPRPGRAVVLGVTAAVCGLDPAQLVRLICNDDVATVSAAVLKIEPVDPLRTTRWVLDCHAQIESIAADLAALTDPAEIPAFSAPLIEEWAELHATTTQRLFRA